MVKIGNPFAGFELGNFFEEWKDREDLMAVTVVVSLLLAVFLLGLWNNFPAERDNTFVFMTLLIISIPILIAEFFKEETTIISANVFGTKPLLPIIVGVVLGWVLVSGGVASVGIPAALTISPFLVGFLYVVVLAPIVEEIAFRGILQPTLNRTLQGYSGKIIGGIMAVFLQAGIFTFYHLRVLGGNLDMLGPIFMFAVIATAGNYLFRSLAFSTSFHFVNNFLVWSRMIA